MTLQIQLAKQISLTSEGKNNLRIWTSATDSVDPAIFLMRHMPTIPGGTGPSAVFVRVCTVSDLYNYPKDTYDSVRSHYRTSWLNLLFTSRLSAEHLWLNIKDNTTVLLGELKSISEAPAESSVILSM